jgi:hypothetical protein
MIFPSIKTFARPSHLAGSGELECFAIESRGHAAAQSDKWIRTLHPTKQLSASHRAFVSAVTIPKGGRDGKRGSEFGR